MADQTTVDPLLKSKNDTFESSKYNVKNLMYPIDLMGQNGVGASQYGGNYVILYINVPTESYIIKKNQAQTIDDYTPRDRGGLVGQNYKKAGSLVTAGVGSSVIGGTVIGALGGEGGAGITAIGSAATLAGLGVESGEFNRPVKRLKSAIALHIPNSLSIRYSSNWTDDDTSTFQAVHNIGEDTVNILKKAAERMFDSDVDILGPLEKLGKSASPIAAAVALNTSFGKGALSNMTGLAANPKKEQIFKGVDFRTFEFDYQFAPRSENEAREVLNIIYMLKLHMHPEFKDAANFLYVYPSEFDISYYTNDVENPNLHKHTSCVLTDLQVNYTPNGTFNTFPNGMPTQINVTLQFRELALLSKEKIEGGY